MSLTETLIWPLAMLTMVWVLRAPIKDLLRAISRIRASGFGSNVDLEFSHLEFSQGVEESFSWTAVFARDLATSSREVLTPPDSEPVLSGMPDSLPGFSAHGLDVLRTVAYNEPRSAILAAWLVLNTELTALDRKLNPQQSSVDSITRIPRLVGAYSFSFELGTLITHLRNLRNTAAHRTEAHEISQHSAHEYIGAVNRALNLLKQLESPSTDG